MTATRRLIVNADDFGLSTGVNRGILAAHDRGIVTSASLMVRGEAAAAAMDAARTHPLLDVGLHIDLAEWRLEKGQWVPIYEVVDIDDVGAVEREIRHQLDQFRRVAEREPTHLDSHQHGHRRDALAKVVAGIANEIGAPLRHVTPGLRFCGDFYGQDSDGSALPSHITADALIRLLRNLSPGVTELSCHPGHADDLPTMYRSERAIETAALCDPRVRQALDAEGIELTRFSTLRQ